MTDLRIGVLGAARIAPSALIAPARNVNGVSVSALAARDRDRASAFAAKHGVPRVAANYREMIEDPDLDAVYIPLPNGLHHEWALAAIAAGKHVLCEKPLTANAAQARDIDTAWRSAGRVTFMEAFHYRYHPLAARMRAVVDEELGEVERVETSMCFPLPRFGDIRYNFDLAGGALMDAGCYAIHVARLLGPGEPTVTDARSKLLGRNRRIDRATSVSIRYPNGATGRANCSMWSSSLLRISARVVGSRGELRVFNFVAPQVFHRITVVTAAGRRHERVAGESTYTYQLRAFLAACRGDSLANLTPPPDSIATMSLIDAAYEAAGLPARG